VNSEMNDDNTKHKTKHNNNIELLTILLS